MASHEPSPPTIVFLVGWKCITSDEHNTPPRANAPPDLVVVCPSFLVLVERVGVAVGDGSSVHSGEGSEAAAQRRQARGCVYNTGVYSPRYLLLGTALNAPCTLAVTKGSPWARLHYTTRAHGVRASGQSRA